MSEYSWYRSRGVQLGLAWFIGWSTFVLISIGVSLTS